MHRQPVATASNHCLHHAYHGQHPHAATTLQPYYHEPAFAASLCYRTSPTPGQLLPSPVVQQQQQQQQQQQLALAHGFHTPNLRHRQTSRHHLRLLSHRPRHYAFSRPAMAAPPQHMSSEEMEEMQRLSNQYEPKATGPLVGQRQPSTAITNEYAGAGQVYQQKTAALPQKYSHYRTVRGDGRCGWRAIAFGYYEGLIRLGDANKFLEEEARLRSLSNILNAAGFQPYLYDDFADEVFDLLRKLSAALAAGNAERILEETFNDDNVSMYIITHLRSLAAAWMKTNPGNYEAFLMGQTVHQYTETNIMPVTSEIEHVGLSALNSVFLAPSGIGLEVSYLDQSAGGEVNIHRFDGDGQGLPPIHVVRLLYRPGHYDILYKPEDVPPEPQAIVPTYLQYSAHPHQEPAYDLGVSDFMTMIPGMSYANSCGGWMSSNSSSSFASSDLFRPASTAAQAPPPTMPDPTTPASQAPIPQQLQPQPSYSAHAPTTAQLLPPPTQMPQELAVRTGPPAPISHPIQHQLAGGGPFRPSMWELEPDFVQATSQMPFQTSIFRNSHFNTAHFLNPDFQPEEWSPETEYVTTTAKSRQKSTSSG